MAIPSRTDVRRSTAALLGALLILTSASAQAQPAPTPLEDNRTITLGYIDIAYELGGIIDPTLQPGGTSSVRPNWFTFAPHASQAGGKGMYGAALARHFINTARLQPSLSLTNALDRLGLSGVLRSQLQDLSLQLIAQGLTVDAATALSVLTSSLNAAALGDVRTLLATASRMGALYWSAPGASPLDKVEAIVITLERTLHEGNLAIYNDIGGSARLYLDWRAAATGPITPARVLTEFTLADANNVEAQQAYAYAVAHAEDSPRPTRMDLIFPGMHWKSLLIAAFALYEDARLAPTPARRDALVAMGTNFVAWREQYDQAQPVFTPAGSPTDEVSRAAVLQMLTPFLMTDFGTVRWTYADYAYAQPDRDGNPLTSPPCEYSWADFWDRWNGILFAFDKAYARPSELWVMPEPLMDPLG
ncbi:hypothetical protein HJC10_28800 [Corallococcus exiguus]|uniref:hypothetical protein n=1 Tax=Corallococcus TaxID=83461 RepID=UPI000ECAEF08|nr:MULTISPECIES: hypothetical protein [Corallococcus]NNC06836.1 hypothetical protein [Corallococcus exiguus]NPC50646.1 hypothetical protein [Corallococcus exiguus]RKH79197.1 hypothetical protein D7X99_25760 [Corallococcus sp. AB032C]